MVRGRDLAMAHGHRPQREPRFRGNVTDAAAIVFSASFINAITLLKERGG
jgi:hypothetical protein